MIVNLGIFIASVIAAIIALRSVNDARQARDEASAHERTATRSASAAEVAVRHHERTADTLERQTALLESAATHREDWALEALTDASIDQQWKATNKTGDDVMHVSIGTPDGFNEQWIRLDAEEAVDVPRGGSIFFTFISTAQLADESNDLGALDAGGRFGAEEICQDDSLNGDAGTCSTYADRDVSFWGVPQLGVRYRYLILSR